MEIEQLVQVGGKLWEKGNMRRVYFNDLAEWYGLDCSYYNSGNISSARLDGEPISNSQARRIAGELAMAKFWYDLCEGTFYGRGLDADDIDLLAARIRERVATLTEQVA